MIIKYELFFLNINKSDSEGFVLTPIKMKNNQNFFK